MRVRAGKIRAPHDHRIQNHNDGLQPWCDTCHLSAGFQRPRPLAELFENLERPSFDIHVKQWLHDEMTKELNKKVDKPNMWDDFDAPFNQRRLTFFEERRMQNRAELDAIMKPFTTD